MGIVSMKALLESGVHFGHQTRRWNPKMSQYIFVARNGIHIIDLQKTMQMLKHAYKSMKDLAEQNGQILFVGTKKQAKAAIVEHAEKCGMFHISERWPGGLLTNFVTVKKSITRLKDLEEMKNTDVWDAETKKEILNLNRELTKKSKMLSGIKNMNKLPDALFIIDPKKEAIAVKEAIKLGIPIYAVVDTNCNPEEIDFPVPGNDDAIRAIGVFLKAMSSAISEGKALGQQEEDFAEKEIIATDEAETAVDFEIKDSPSDKENKEKKDNTVQKPSQESSKTPETEEIAKNTTDTAENTTTSLD